MKDFIRAVLWASLPAELFAAPITDPALRFRASLDTAPPPLQRPSYFWTRVVEQPPGPRAKPGDRPKYARAPEGLQIANPADRAVYLPRLLSPPTAVECVIEPAAGSLPMAAPPQPQYPPPPTAPPPPVPDQPRSYSAPLNWPGPWQGDVSAVAPSTPREAGTSAQSAPSSSQSELQEQAAENQRSNQADTGARGARVLMRSASETKSDSQSICLLTIRSYSLIGQTF